MSDTLTEKIIAAAIEVHRHLGPGLLESIYESAVFHKLQLRGLEAQQQIEVDVEYKGKAIQGQRVDLLVEGQVIIELEAISTLPEVATAQTLSNLKATGLKRALLINFGCKTLVEGVKRLFL